MAKKRTVLDAVKAAFTESVLTVQLENVSGHREPYDVPANARPFRIVVNGQVFDQSAVEDGVWIYRSVT